MYKLSLPSFSQFPVWCAYLLGEISILPYIFFLSAYPALSFLIPKPELLPHKELIVGFVLLRAAFWGAAFLQFSSYVSKKAAITPLASRSLQEKIYPAIPLGLLLGLLLGLGGTLLALLVPYCGALLTTLTNPPLWSQFLACTHTITADVLFRLCVLPALLAMLNTAFNHTKSQHSSLVVWSAILVTGFIASIGTLRGTRVLLEIHSTTFGIPPSWAIDFLVLITTITESFFCWLFVKKGFWAAALAHIIAYCVAIGIFALHLWL